MVNNFMFGFSFSNYQKDLAQDVSFLTDYAYLTKAYTASTWIGRVIYLIASVGYSPSLLLIGELAQKYFSAPVKTKPSHFFSVSEVEEEQGSDEIQDSDEIFDSQKDEVKENPSAEFDDEAFAKSLQQEEYGFSNSWNSKNDPLSKPSIVDDEEYARKLQRQFDNDRFNNRRDPYKDPFGHQFRDPHARPNSFDQDDEFARLLEYEFYGNQRKPENPPVPAEKEVELTDEEKQEELVMMLKTADGAHQILTTPGLVACVAPENENDPTSKKVTIYELQTGLLRAVAGAVTKEYPHAISPAVLRSQRDANIEQYLAFKFKQFSHIEEVKGTVTLPGNKPIRLEGFFEVFTTPMVISSFDTYSKKSKFFTKADREWILTEFNKMIFCDYVSDKEIEQMVTTLQDPEFSGPLLIQAGFVDHCAAGMWVGDYFLYFDRSSIHVETGIHVYHIPNRELITDAFISKIIKREELTQKNYAIVEDLVTDLGATLVYHQHLPAQKVGNCAKATMDGVLEGLMAVRELLKTHKAGLKDVASGSWQTAFKKVIPEHKNCLASEKKVIFDDMISEIEEWLVHHTSIGQVDLKEAYTDLLTFWMMSSVPRDAEAVKKVQALLKAIQEDKFFA